MSKKNTYNYALNQALKNYHDPEWLGQNSPLASLYFVADWIDGDTITITHRQRGVGLQKMMRAAVDTLWQTEPPISTAYLQEIALESYMRQGRTSTQYHYLLLELRYFRRLFPSGSYPNTSQEFQEFLGIGSTQFFDHLKLAVSNLGDALLQLSQPSFRLEQPAYQVDTIGRDAQLKVLQDGLKQGESAAISGISGIGKTALGRLTVQVWGTNHVFWYTIRPTITDHVGSLVYALGLFLHNVTGQQSILWKQLLVNKEQNLTIDLYLGLIRKDIALLQTPILLCFDEVDLLQNDLTADRVEEHRSLLLFLESLCEFVPVLFMGQHIPLDVKQHIELRPITPEQIRTLIASYNLSLSDDEINALHSGGRGIPRIIELAVSLHKTGEPLDKVLTNLAESSSVYAIIGRLWSRLNKQEQKTMGTLAVLQSGIASELFPPDQQAVLPTLVQRTLLNISADGTIALDELIRRLIYRRCSRELRDHSHLVAADMRHTLGEYTLSAYHCAQAEEYASAINIWFPHKDLEIQRGHSNRAGDIFLNIPSRQLNKKQQKQLQAIRNQLYLLTGNADRIIEETKPLVENTPKQEVDIAHSELRTQLGDAYSLIDNVPDATIHYEESLNEFMRLSEKMMITADKLNILHIRTANIESAKNQLNLLRAYLEYAHGRVEMATSNFKEANSYFENVLSLAESVENEILLANAERRIAVVASYNSDFETALTHYERASHRFLKMGDVVSSQHVQANIGSTYVVVKQYSKAVEKLKPTLDFFEKINDSEAISGTLYSLSEAYFYLGEMNLARSHALRIIRSEIPDHQPYAMHILGLIEKQKSRFDSSIEILQEGIKIAQYKKDRYIEAFLLRAIGTVLSEDLQQLDSARSHYQQAFELFEEMGLTADAKATKQKQLFLTEI